MDHARVLVADPQSDQCNHLAAILAEAGHQVDASPSAQATLERMRQQAYDLLLVDTQLPPTNGIEVLRQVKQAHPSVLVVPMSAAPQVDTVLQAFRSGAFEFLNKPVLREQLIELAHRAQTIREKGEQRRRMADELETERLHVQRLRQEIREQDPFQQLIGSSPVFRSLVSTIREVARTDSTVLLTGESGTGKGRVSHAIHDGSTRCNGPFVEANCVVYSEGLLHSELFGHEKGAFTGAARTKKGRFELARGGTLFLDEIGEITPATQLLLLRVLQDRTFERVGGETTFEADVRLIAATNRNLQQAIADGTFRSDLFYRLNVIPLHVPALREHPEDVPVLIQHFLQRGRQGVQGSQAASLEIRDEAMDALTRYSWPGNIRELENLVERLVVLNRTGQVTLEDLPPAVANGSRAAQVAPATSPTTRCPSGTLQDLERARILEVLNDVGGNKKLAAERLGIHRSTLYAKMRRYGIETSAPVAAGIAV